MSDRPLGITILCLGFGYFGLAGIIGGFSLWGEADTITRELPLSVDVFLFVIPPFTILLGGLTLFAAVTLWGGSRNGWLAGVAALSLWIIEEAVLLVWGLLGPEVIQQFASGGINIARIIIAIVLLGYLIPVGDQYVSNTASTDSPTHQRPTE
jgi:hypothetical protein